MTTDKQTPTWRQQFADEFTNAFVKQLIKRGKATPALCAEQKIMPIPDSGVLIGRDKAADIVTAHDELTSGRHARVYPDGSRLIIEDLGSTNGTWVNENRVWDKAPLSLEDVIRVGQTRIAVTWLMTNEQS